MYRVQCTGCSVQGEVHTILNLGTFPTTARETLIGRNEVCLRLRWTVLNADLHSQTRWGRRERNAEIWPSPRRLPLQPRAEPSAPLPAMKHAREHRFIFTENIGGPVRSLLFYLFQNRECRNSGRLPSRKYHHVSHVRSWCPPRSRFRWGFWPRRRPSGSQQRAVQCLPCPAVTGAEHALIRCTYALALIGSPWWRGWFGFKM